MKTPQNSGIRLKSNCPYVLQLHTIMVNKNTTCENTKGEYCNDYFEGQI